MKHHEDTEQAVVFEWASYFPVLRWMFAIPNGAFLAGDGKARAIQMARLKKQGLKKGVSDIFLPIVKRSVGGHYAGLYIEMKRRRVDGKSQVSSDQADFGKAMIAAGYDYRVCYGASEAIEVITEYANL